MFDIQLKGDPFEYLTVMYQSCEINSCLGYCHGSGHLLLICCFACACASVRVMPCENESPHKHKVIYDVWPCLPN